MLDVCMVFFLGFPFELIPLVLTVSKRACHGRHVSYHVDLFMRLVHYLPMHNKSNLAIATYLGMYI